MPRPTQAEFVAAYEATQPVAPRQEGEAYRMHCVHRQDNNPSLVALQADDGGVVLLDNGASLTLDAYATTLRAVGLLPNGGKAKPKDIPEAQVIPEDRDPANIGVCGAKRTNVFEYRDAIGVPVCEVVRYILPNGSKMIRPRRPHDDGYVWSLSPARDKYGAILPEIDPPLYRLPEALADTSGLLCVAEGEGKVDRLRALGLCAVCTHGGAGQVKRHAVKVRECASGRRVIIFADNDEAGERFALIIAKAVAPVAKEVRIVRFPDLPVGHDIADWLNTGGTKAQLVALADAAEVYRPDVDADTGRDIVVANQGLAEATDEVRDCLRVRNNGPHALYMAAGRIAWVREERVEGLTPDQLTWVLARTVQFVTLNQEKGTTRPIDPPNSIVRMVLADPRPCFPELAGVVTDPFMRPDGSIVTAAGYDEQTRLLLMLPPGYVSPPIPADPTAEHVRAALAVVDELIADFPFDCAGSRASALALLFTLVLRPMLGRTHIPMFLADATKPRTGKGLLVGAMLRVAFGHLGAWGRLPRTEEEMGKTIMAALSDCTPAVCFDNIVGMLDSESLCAVLTAVEFSQRRLGRNDAGSTLRAENNTVFLATGNGCTLGYDLARRTVWIRLDAKCPEPGERSGFRIPDLTAYAMEHRVKIRAAVLTVARAWFLAGQPPAPMLPTMGGFERWVSVIGSILHFAGVDGFLANAQSMREAVSNPADDHSEFVQRLWETFRAEFTARDLADKLGHALRPDERTGNQRDFASTLPDRVGSALGRPTFNNEVGKFLSRIRDSITPGGLVLRLVKKDRNGIAQWRVEFTGVGDPPARSRPDDSEY